MQLPKCQDFFNKRRSAAAMRYLFAATLLLESISPSFAVAKESFKTKKDEITAGASMGEVMIMEKAQKTKEVVLAKDIGTMQNKTVNELVDLCNPYINNIQSSQITIRELSDTEKKNLNAYFKEISYGRGVGNTLSLDSAKALYPEIMNAFDESKRLEKARVKKSPGTLTESKELIERYDSYIDEINKGVKLAKKIEAKTEETVEAAQKLNSNITTIGLGFLSQDQAGQVVEHQRKIADAAWRLALARRFDAVKDIYEKVKNGESINMKDYGLSVENLWLHTSIDKFMLNNFHDAVIKTPGKPSSLLPAAMITALQNARFGQFKDKDSDLFFNVDNITNYSEGAKDVELSSKYSIDNVVKALNLMAKTGRISSSFNPGFGKYHTMTNEDGIPNELGKDYEFVKILGQVLLDRTISSEAVKFKSNPTELSNLAVTATHLSNEYYRILIGAVARSTNEENSRSNIEMAKASAELFVYIVPALASRTNYAVLEAMADKIRMEHGGITKEDIDTGNDPVFPSTTSINGNIIWTAVKDKTGKVTDKELRDLKADLDRAKPEMMSALYSAAFEGGTYELSVHLLGAVRAEYRGNSIHNMMKDTFKSVKAGKKFTKDDKNSLFSSAVEAINNTSTQMAVEQVPFDLRLKLLKNDVVQATVNFRPEPKEDYLQKPNIRLKPEEITVNMPIFSGLPFGLGENINWHMRNKDLVKKYSSVYNGVESLPKGNRLDLPITLPRDTPTGTSLAVTAVTYGYNLKPYRSFARTNLPSSSAMPMNLPAESSHKIEFGAGGIGGDVAGISARYGSGAASHIDNALRSISQIPNNPVKVLDVNREVFNAAQAAYDANPGKVGGASTKAWLDANRDTAKRGEFISQMPDSLVNSEFGQEISLVRVQNPYLKERVASMTDMDIGFRFSKSGVEVYFKTGFMSVTEYYKVATVDFDSNGNPNVNYIETTPGQAKKYPIMGFGANFPSITEKFEYIYSTEGEHIIRAMATEDQKLLDKRLPEWFKTTLIDWNGSFMELTGQKMLSTLKLFEETSVRYIDDRWTFNFRTNNLGVKPFGWLGNTPLASISLDYKTAFSIEVDPEGGFSGMNIDPKAGQILQLGSKKEGYEWSIWDFYGNDLSMPAAIGGGVFLKNIKTGKANKPEQQRTYDIGIGVSFSRKAGRKYVDPFDLLNTSIPNGHLTLRF